MKKGAAKPGSNAAILIFIIGLSLVVYAILDDSISDGYSINHNSDDNVKLTKSVYLLRENVGHLSGDVKNDEEFVLPSITLYTKLNSNIFLSIPKVDVNSNVFGNTNYESNFTLDDLNIVKNLILTFNGETGSKKPLIVSINGVEVFHGIVNSNNLVKINKNVLKKGNNVLKFSSEYSFFGNHIVVNNVQVIGDLYDLTKNKASVDLTIFKEELKNFESTSMGFYVDCFEPDIGLLRIYVNGDKIYEAVPDCNIYNQKIQVPLYDLKSGNNIFRFENDYGSYVLDQVTLKADYIKPIEPIYYFAIAKDTYIDKDFKLNMKFPDRTNKDGLLYVNDHHIVLNTDALNISYNIKDFVEEGFNYIKIVPNDDMDIAELNVEITDKD